MCTHTIRTFVCLFVCFFFLLMYMHFLFMSCFVLCYLKCCTFTNLTRVQLVCYLTLVISINWIYLLSDTPLRSTFCNINVYQSAGYNVYSFMGYAAFSVPVMFTYFINLLTLSSDDNRNGCSICSLLVKCFNAYLVAVSLRIIDMFCYIHGNKYTTI